MLACNAPLGNLKLYFFSLVNFFPPSLSLAFPLCISISGFSLAMKNLCEHNGSEVSTFSSADQHIHFTRTFHLSPAIALLPGIFYFLSTKLLLQGRWSFTYSKHFHSSCRCCMAAWMSQAAIGQCPYLFYCSVTHSLCPCLYHFLKVSLKLIFIYPEYEEYMPRVYVQDMKRASQSTTWEDVFILPFKIEYKTKMMNATKYSLCCKTLPCYFASLKKDI